MVWMRIECIPLCHYAMLLKCCKSLGGCHLKHPGNEPPSRSAKQLIFPTWSSQWWTSNVDHPMNQFLANEWYRKELCNIVMQLLPASTQLLLLHKKKNSGGKHMCAMVIPPWLGLIMGTWSSTFMGDSNFRLWFITIHYHPFSHSVLLLFLSYSCNVGPPNDS